MARKAVPTVKRSAASRKAWRTRKKMQAAREAVPVWVQIGPFDEAEYKKLEQWKRSVAGEANKCLLPCPNFGEKL